MAAIPHKLKVCPYCECLPWYHEARPGDERNGYMVTGVISCSNDECGARMEATSSGFTASNFKDNNEAITRMQEHLARRWNRRDGEGDYAE